jgi:hypothetical protein
VLALAALAGFAQALDRASSQNLGDRITLPAIFGLSFLLGCLGGVISLYLGGLLLGWSGHWIGGRGTLAEIRAAMAWSRVPVIAALLLWAPALALFGRELFTSKTPILDASRPLTAAMMGFSVVEFGLGIWSLVLLLKCLGEVQGFSAWKALGNILLLGMLLAAVLILAAVLLLALARW